jgi:hypothetical protein
LPFAEVNRERSGSDEASSTAYRWTGPAGAQPTNVAATPPSTNLDRFIVNLPL